MENTIPLNQYATPSIFNVISNACSLYFKGGYVQKCHTVGVNMFFNGNWL